VNAEQLMAKTYSGIKAPFFFLFLFLFFFLFFFHFFCVECLFLPDYYQCLFHQATNKGKKQLLINQKKKKKVRLNIHWCKFEGREISNSNS
jgi:predicted membrane protein